MKMVPTLSAIGLMLGVLTIPNRDVVTDNVIRFGLLIAGLIILRLTVTYQSKHNAFSQHELSWDEPLGARIAEVIALFSKKPNKLVLFPSLIANAGALPDGSVIVTSALRHIATNDEIAAVVAHEISHIRDEDPKRITRFRGNLTTIYSLPACAVVFLGFNSPNAPIFAVMGGFLIFSLAIPFGILFARFSHPIEFKCDRTAARLSLGPDLASCLDKLTRFTGGPSRWIGLDRYLVTHPSLEDRIKEIEKHATDAANPA